MQPNESYNFGGHYYYWLNLVMMNIMLKPSPKLDHSIKLGYCTSKNSGLQLVQWRGRKGGLTAWHCALQCLADLFELLLLFSPLGQKRNLDKIKSFR